MKISNAEVKKIQKVMKKVRIKGQENEYYIDGRKFYINTGFEVVTEINIDEPNDGKLYKFKDFYGFKGNEEYYNLDEKVRGVEVVDFDCLYVDNKEYEEVLSLTKDNLKILKKYGYNTSQDNLKNIFIKKGKIFTVDGYRVVSKDCKSDAELAIDIEIIDIVYKLMRTKSLATIYKADDTGFYVSIDDKIKITKKIGNVPCGFNINDLFSMEEDAKTLIIHRDTLLSCLKKYKSKSLVAKITVAGDRTLNIENKEIFNLTEDEICTSEEEFEIRLNTKYLYDLVKDSKNEDVYIKYLDNGKPVFHEYVVNGEKYSELLLPIISR